MTRAGALVLLLGALAGCPQDDIWGPPTETVCPPGGTSLTYTDFGKPFMEKYCTRCHHSELVGSARKGAPSFHDFDSLFGIKAVSGHIDETTGSGPAATNTGMPPDGAKPTKAEREMLSQWIACGMPQ